jgi:MoxR-like ATPase
MTDKTLRPPVETLFQAELTALKQHDVSNPKLQKPASWVLSPQSVVLYLLGGKTQDGTPISPKYIGQKRLIETAVATLATDRALLLLGVPGTAKSWVSEHIAAAVSGNSQLLIQGTSGIDENQIRYGWNYAMLLAKGPSHDALVATPLLRAMQSGAIVRLEELTRMGSDIQDTLITILSEKVLPIPELNDAIYAAKGFNVIATANDRDKGVNELSAALKRRFNVVVLPLPETAEEEVNIVAQRVAAIGGGLHLPEIPKADKEIARLVTLFRELRSGETADGRHKVKSPSSTLSAADAISVTVGAWSEAVYFGEGIIDADRLANNIIGAVVKDPVQDRIALEEYLENVVKQRKDWRDMYTAIREML